MATLSKFFVITIRPRLKVIKFQVLQGSADTLPLISWQMVVIQSADSSRIVDPVLAIARGTNIFFHQVSVVKFVFLPPRRRFHSKNFESFFSSFARCQFNPEKQVCNSYGI